MDYLADGFKQAIFMLVSGDFSIWSAVWVTVKASSIAMIISLLIGVPLGFMLGYYRFKGRNFLLTIVNTLLSVPTVAIGLIVYLLLSHSGPLGEFGLLFSIKAIAIGQCFLAVPIIIALVAAAIESMDDNLKSLLLTLGAGRWQTALTTLSEARYAVYAASVTAYGRVISEVGISMMVGGNIKWHTRSITTAIALETGKGEFAMGIALGLILVLIAFTVNFTAMHFRERFKA